MDEMVFSGLGEEVILVISIINLHAVLQESSLHLIMSGLGCGVGF
jgi:hypothetical protein